ncbi:hypothetical protein Clacol_002343 [Clathrus columnatus]|uniref:Protein kinase domain-containing protein n=1 Tax=Clathrus columnatus TaxID=1419009 RepID=A0AAV5A561_9AGAM|nr:hypothetical protein Clacol_002343 [Clathrus columnatus]
MRHRFVAVKLLPRLPGWAKFGQKHRDIIRESNLFVISSEEPTSPGSEYFVLKNKWDMNTNSDPTRTLNVKPSLPFNETLYLSVTPRICAEFEDTEEYNRLVNAEKYRLDKASFQRFLEAWRNAGPSIPGICETGGEDEVDPVSELTKYTTWSGYLQYGALVSNREVQFNFDLVPFQSLSRADLRPRIYDELVLLRQLTLDYASEKCDITTQYIQTERKNLPLLAASGQIFRVPSVSQQRFNPFTSTLRPSLANLQSFPIPCDEDPINGDFNEDSDGMDDWLNDNIDYNYPELPPEVSPVPAVRADGIKMIVFDPNVLVVSDYDGPLKEALVKIFPPSICRFTGKELLELYVEREALRAADKFPEFPVSPAGAIQDIASHLDLPIEQSIITDALKYHTELHLHSEVSTTLDLLIDRGYTLHLLNSPSHYHQTVLSHLPNLTLLTLASLSTHPTLRKNQVLVVTNDIYRVAESASRVGFPTALMKRLGSRSAELVIPHAPTTYTSHTLNELLSVLEDPASAPDPREPFDPKIHREAYMFYAQIHDCYQIVGMFGMGSFEFVFRGIQLYTGSHVTIKFSFDTLTLPYEAAVYAQLKGVPGLPRVHWNGSGKGYALVMDKLGPNLAQLKSFCRGRLSLKTVLMLGEQMLSTIEGIHSRGIIVRDIKPEKFAMGCEGDYKRFYLFDLGFSKLWFDPGTPSNHMPFREGRIAIYTPEYMSCNAHSGFELGRRDDIESIGYLLLYLLHGRLPWQDIGPLNVPSNMRRMQNMKFGKPFTDFLAHEKTPKCFNTFFEHCRSLAFEDQPNYTMLRELFKKEFEKHGWGEYDWEYDWWKGNGLNEGMGTLIPEEYRLDRRFVEPLLALASVVSVEIFVTPNFCNFLSQITDKGGQFLRTSDILRLRIVA